MRPSYLPHSPIIEIGDVPYFNQHSFTMRNTLHLHLDEFLFDAIEIFKAKLERAIEVQGSVKVEIAFLTIYVNRTSRDLEHMFKHIHALWIYNTTNISDYWNMFLEELDDVYGASYQTNLEELISEITVYLGDLWLKKVH